MIDGVPVLAAVPHKLRLLPFRGSDAIRRGLIGPDALRGDAFRRLLPDVFVAADIHADYRVWCHAAAEFTAPHGAIAGLSAAFMYGVDLRGSIDAPIDVAVPTAARIDAVPRVHVIRSPLPPSHVTIVAGIRVTTPERTGFDLARRLPLVDAVVAIDALCFRRVVKPADLAAFASFHRRWPGGKQLRATLELAEPMSESPTETRLRLALVDRGLPAPVAQHEVRDDGRYLGRLNLAYPQWKIGISAVDPARQIRLCAAGWTILRFTSVDEPSRVVEAVQSLRSQQHL
jgi:transcriptional regulator with AbiEi antitoxin domain of type IV toxin-antitoxin system